MYSNDGEKVADFARVVLNLADAKLRDEHFMRAYPSALSMRYFRLV